jgi:acid ceramidase
MFQVLRDEDTFNGALERLSNNKIIAPGYYILSGVGPDEGAIIERKRRNYNAIYFLNNTNWFIVQTNYDRSQPDPSGDYRRTPAEERL